MMDGQESLSSLREILLPDRCSEQELADALGCSRRTIQRLGLSYMYGLLVDDATP
jgi:hypothetical protein